MPNDLVRGYTPVPESGSDHIKIARAFKQINTWVRQMGEVNILLDTGDGSGTWAADNALIKTSGAGTTALSETTIIVDDSENVSGVGTLGCGAITTSGRLSIEDNPAQVWYKDTGGGADDKILSLKVDSGIAGWSSRTDAGALRQTNMLTLDLGDGKATIGSAAIFESTDSWIGPLFMVGVNATRVLSNSNSMEVHSGTDNIAILTKSTTEYSSIHFMDTDCATAANSPFCRGNGYDLEIGTTEATGNIVFHSADEIMFNGNVVGDTLELEGPSSGNVMSIHAHRSDPAATEPIVKIEQDSTSGVHAPLELKQADTDQAFIELTGTDQGNFTPGATFAHSFYVSINGNLYKVGCE